MSYESIRVCVIWRDNPKSQEVNTLIYRPEGTVRTYETTDEEDSLPGLGDLRVNTMDELIKALQPGDGKKIVVPVILASQFGRSWDFA